jgi:uncharacterized protein YyaL (SSP411 family)
MAYLEAYQATGNDEYAQSAREIFEYVRREMTDSKGGFYSAEDADSEGEEGKFYVWNFEEIGRIFGEQDAELIMKFYNLEEDGNFEDQATGKKTGDNIIHLKKSWAELADENKLNEEELGIKMEAARIKLFDNREKRTRPHKDDKILTDWNGLMIAAYAMGGRILNESEYREAAREAADFILNNMWDSDGELLHRYRDGESGIRATLDDYAFLIWGLMELYQSGFDIKYLKAALELNGEMLELFWDDDNGGLFYSAVASDDSDDLIVRQKEIYDGALPSGNSVAAYNLMRLSRITADIELEKKAEKIGMLFSSEVKRTPSAYSMLLNSIDYGVGPSHEIVISGEEKSSETAEMLEVLNSRFMPNKVVIFRSDEEAVEVARIAPYTEYQKAQDGKTTAYVCLGFACNLPTSDSDEMIKQIESGLK